MKPLVIRPLPYKDESLRGYILRASEANLYPDSKMLFRFAGLQKYNKFDNLLIPDKDLDFSKIRVLLSNENIMNMVLVNQLGSEELIQHEGIRFHLWRYGTCAHKQRVCPVCITEAPYHRDIWELSLFITCPLHNCSLVDQCEGCGTRIHPYRQCLLQCKCGFDYRWSKVEYKESESSFSAYLFKRFYKGKNLPKNLNMVNEISLSSFIYLMIVASRWVNGTLNKRTVTNFSEPIKESNLDYILDRSLNIFREWPLNFYEFIDDFRLNKKIGKQSLTNYSKFRALIKGNLEYPQYDFIHESLNYYLLNFLQSGYSGSIKANEIILSKNYRKVRASTIRNHNKAFTEGTTRKEASEILGVGLNQFDYFVSRKIIKPIHGPEEDGNPYILFNQDDLISLLEEIEHKVDNDFDPSRLITFYKAAKIAVHYDMALSDFLLELLKGKLHPNTIGEGKGLNRFYFDAKKLEDYFIGEFLTIKEISEKLKVKRASVERWVKLGYIKVSRTYRSGKFQLISIEHYEEFRRKYIPAVEIVRTHKLINSSEKLLADLSSLGIKPINKKLVSNDMYLLKVNDELIKYMNVLCSPTVRKKRHPPLGNYYYIK